MSTSKCRGKYSTIVEKSYRLWYWYRIVFNIEFFSARRFWRKRAPPTAPPGRTEKFVSLGRQRSDLAGSLPPNFFPGGGETPAARTTLRPCDNGDGIGIKYVTARGRSSLGDCVVSFYGSLLLTIVATCRQAPAQRAVGNFVSPPDGTDKLRSGPATFFFLF